ncbi:hypothetical protein [Streptomyces sp. NPDC047108]|uniref:hypothetical protein n=1 Tax=Streptomyces sp. NPDC047108 TaxID=3155025 RepID=UPI0033C16822
MTKLSVRGAGSGTQRSRTVAAAARAAARRAEKAQRPAEREPGAVPPRGAGTVTGDEPAADEPAAEGHEAETEDSALSVPSAPDDDGVAARPRRERRSALLSGGLALFAVAALIATAVLGWEYRDAGRTDSARTEALAAARKAAPEILSYDYRHLERDFAAAKSHLTGPFREKYGKTTKSVVAPTAKRYHGVVKATVATPSSGDAPAASVVSASPDKVVVLLFMNQVTNSTQVSGPRLDLNRVRMTLQQADGGWKVSAVDAL